MSRIAGILAANILILGNTTSISYNKYGQPVSVTDALSNTTTFEYDEYGNLVKATDPLGNSAFMKYDLISRLLESTDPKGRTTSYSFTIFIEEHSYYPPPLTLSLVFF
jgi:YD repeat-containing protein